jgi:hypothetical protein
MNINYCWICRKPSETSEHRIKKSDIIRQFGKGPYRGINGLTHVKSDKMRDLQGPDSSLIKYEKNLCSNCNNKVTQPFDVAYEQFIAWVTDNEIDVLKRRVIDFEAVYGIDWEEKQRNLFKYFAKCFGCRIDGIGRLVPFDVINLIGKDFFETALHVTFQVNEDMLLFKKEDQFVGTFPIIGDPENSIITDLGRYYCGHFYQWLIIMYWYNFIPLEPVGASWVANSKFIYLGWYQSIDEDSRSSV